MTSDTSEFSSAMIFKLRELSDKMDPYQIGRHRQLWLVKMYFAHFRVSEYSNIIEHSSYLYQSFTSILILAIVFLR